MQMGHLDINWPTFLEERLMAAAMTLSTSESIAAPECDYATRSEADAAQLTKSLASTRNSWQAVLTPKYARAIQLLPRLSKCLDRAIDTLRFAP
jgi:hypothetical protein